ncbi:MAG TPA: glutathione transferase [Kofleriaceae bacterium]|nr:glutathione transferase [Kofleriaceae bacterium]
MHPLTLYVEGYFTNVWDASCIVALTEKQLEFATARALLRDGQGVPPALREKAAIGRIPALQHGELWLTESLAIIEYLEDTFPLPRVLPEDPTRRARMRQVMTWLRSDLWALRGERPWQLMVYPTRVAPLSVQAEREAAELIALVEWLAARDELAVWNIAHADLAFALMRLAASGHALPAASQALLDANLARPSVRAYVDHARPPNPPPQPRS